MKEQTINKEVELAGYYEDFLKNFVSNLVYEKGTK